MLGAGVGQPRYVALVSGLGVGAPGADPLRAQLLVDHLSGHLGGSEVRAAPPLPEKEHNEG